mmetsp:Transcript_62666/g.149538  ORF Transcript_62666/g.149538 Transcript_62666/m.149538 type:complete len:250 (+) Transcript_62666:1975-2724(+)
MWKRSPLEAAVLLGVEARQSLHGEAEAVWPRSLKAASTSSAHSDMALGPRGAGTRTDWEWCKLALYWFEPFRQLKLFMKSCLRFNLSDMVSCATVASADFCPSKFSASTIAWNLPVFTTKNSWPSVPLCATTLPFGTKVGTAAAAMLCITSLLTLCRARRFTLCFRAASRNACSCGVFSDPLNTSADGSRFPGTGSMYSAGRLGKKSLSLSPDSSKTFLDMESVTSSSGPCDTTVPTFSRSATRVCPPK